MIIIIFDLANFLNGNDDKFHIEGELNSSYLPDNIDIKTTDPIKYSGQIYKVDGDYVLHLDINYDYQSNCDRCLDNISKSMTTVLHGRLESKSRDHNEDDQEYDIIYYDRSLLNLDKYIESQVVSSLPMKVICDNNCKGLCTTCGVNLNEQSCDCVNDSIDPRLEKLKELFPEK